MPIFDFVCTSCGCEFEALVLRERDRILCPGCGSDSAKRKLVALFSCTSLQLTKRLKRESEEKIQKGKEMMKNRPIRKDRIKIL